MHYADFIKRQIFDSPQFNRDRVERKLGTHSRRKFDATFCRSNEGSNDDTDKELDDIKTTGLLYIHSAILA